MPEPDKIGKVGTVLITYRPGHSGPTIVAGMPEWDFGRLRTLVSTYEEHDKTVDQLNDHPNRRTRNQVRGILGLPLQGPELHMQSEMFDFPMYDLRGWRSKTAVNRRVIKLEPKHIQQVTFTRVVEVSN